MSVNGLQVIAESKAVASIYGSVAGFLHFHGNYPTSLGDASKRPAVEMILQNNGNIRATTS